jgi:hypothetical protein
LNLHPSLLSLSSAENPLPLLDRQNHPTRSAPIKTRPPETPGQRLEPLPLLSERYQTFCTFSGKAIYHRVEGLPRRINQTAIHTLIRAAVLRKDKIDEPFLKQQVFTSALFDPNFDE